MSEQRAVMPCRAPEARLFGGQHEGVFPERALLCVFFCADKGIWHYRRWHICVPMVPYGGVNGALWRYRQWHGMVPLVVKRW